LTPYAYCANNPIKLVDPNGEEIYEFDENGKYIKTSGEEGSADQILIRKTDGSTVAGKEYANGTFKNDFTRSIEQENGNPVDVSFLKITGDQNAEEAFKFVADNTSVEWSLTNVGAASGDKGISYLSNSQEKSHEGSAGYLSSNNYTIRGHTHNHPGGDPWPSNNDMNSAKNMQEKFGNIPCNIYVKGERYFQYNSKGIINKSDRIRAFSYSMSKYMSKYK
jgi:proteasome lid subunit RPN8/RPN11